MRYNTIFLCFTYAGRAVSFVLYFSISLAARLFGHNDWDVQKCEFFVNRFAPQHITTYRSAISETDRSNKRTYNVHKMFMNSIDYSNEFLWPFFGRHMSKVMRIIFDRYIRYLILISLRVGRNLIEPFGNMCSLDGDALTIAELWSEVKMNYILYYLKPLLLHQSIFFFEN